jgi:tetratricopeptide (TPR) repeat protein
MEIHVRLAGVELGPYTEKQVREYLSEGLLSATDLAKAEGSDNWVPVNDLLGGLEQSPDADAEETPETKRAPDAPEGVTHFPQKQDSKRVSLPSVLNALARKTMPIGPSAPKAPSSTGQASLSNPKTAPLSITPQGTKKVARASLVKALAQNTAPLPTKSITPLQLPKTVRVPPPAPTSSSSPSTAPLPSAPPYPRDNAQTKPLEKNPSLPSLIKALTAKTAPLRTAPMAPPVPPQSAITAPMPTRSPFKTAEGTTPPPSVAKALSKKLGRVSIPESPAPTSPPTLGDAFDTTKIVPIKPSGLHPASSSSTPGTEKVEAAKEPAAPRPPRRKLPFLISACAVLALFALYYVWSPYHAAASLRNALNGGNPGALESAIDFPSIRASLKDQIKVQLSPANSKTVLAMIDNSIDQYVTPEGLSNLLAKSSDNSSGTDQSQAQAVSPGVASQLLLEFNSQPVKEQGLASFNDFILNIDVALLHLQFNGLGWKLKQIVLRPDLQLASVSTGPDDSAPSLISPITDTYLQRGDAKAKKNDWKGAIADYTQLLEIDPKSSATYLNRGLARQSSQDLDGAINDFTKAIAINPDLATAYNARGIVKTTKNDLDGAIADYTEAIRIDPKLAMAYDSRGNARTAKDNLEGAISDYTHAITIDPTLANAYSDRGFARQANGNLEGALADYTQALVLKPTSAITYYHRGLAQQIQGNLDAAIVDYDRAIAFDPKLAGAFYSRGNAKNATHDLDGAIADYTQAITLDPKIALAYSDRGQARQAKGDLEGALSDYTQALTIDPKIAIAYFQRGLIKEQKNDLDGAISDSTQALYLDPKNAQAFYNRGFAKLCKGNLEGAQVDLKAFCDAAPTDHFADHARLYLWLIAKAQNSKIDADQLLSDALQTTWNSTPDDLTTKTASFLLGRMNEADYLAAASSPDAKTEQSQQCQAWYFAGMKRLLMGDKETAASDFNKCIETKQSDLHEYMLARAELQALGPVTAPTSVAGPGSTPVAAPVPAKN